MATYLQNIQRLVREYREAGQPWPATSRQIGAWMMSNDLWKPHPERVLTQCAEDISRALRDEFFTDAQGRTVRAKHAARVGRGAAQLVLWADVRTAPREHMEIAFKQRRQQIVGDCRQLRDDVESFNQNRSAERPIQVVFDFRDDLAEMDAVA
jgi:hypothetical protein